MKTLSSVACAMLMSISAVAWAQDTRTKPVDKAAPDYVRCVKILETGSLVKKTKICRTNAEWRRSADDGRKNADDIIMHNRGGVNTNG